MLNEISISDLPYNAKIDFQLQSGRFLVKTLQTDEELKNSFLLRYQVFQVEMIGNATLQGEDRDQFDFASDHLAIFEIKTHQLVATCRIKCSRFSNQFYTEQEFNCESLLQRPEAKVELGRVCVHRNFRNGTTLLLLWKAIALYMEKTQARFLFGCGSVSTLQPEEVLLIYRFLQEEKKLRNIFNVSPTEKYRCNEFEYFEKLQSLKNEPLSQSARKRAQELLPPLCRSYFDMGCFISGPPAFDREFQCVDFLTILDFTELAPRLRQKLLGKIANA